MVKDEVEYWSKRGRKSYEKRGVAVGKRRINDYIYSSIREDFKRILDIVKGRSALEV